MAKKDMNLVVAYFPSADEAHAAGKEIKQWDKDLKAIDLGAMSIITMNKKGELKHDKVGDRAGGKGAKWGTIAGAALGILTGGVTLVGGALVGLAVGGLGGSVFHKNIGMTDEDEARLENHLKEGGAALAIMMDEDELEGTISQLNRLQAKVDTYNVPQQVLDDVERTAKGDMLIKDLAAKYTSQT